MDPALLLLLLRILAAVLLLAFLGTIGWLIYRDIRTTRDLLAERGRAYGVLRVLGGDGSSDRRSDGVYPLRPVTSIGRASANTIVLDDDYVSNEHAMLMLRGRQWWLEDLNSRNGTLLNDVRLVTPTVISPGDIITIGSTRLKLESST